MKIAGDQPPRELRKFHNEAAGISVLGKVANLTSFFGSARVFVVPHQYGD